MQEPHVRFDVCRTVFVSRNLHDCVSGLVVRRAGSPESVIGFTVGPWMDLTGSFDAETGVSGLTILCHPETPGMPRRWVLRRGRSMQNQVYPGRVPVPISKETPVRLRYRMLIHRGELAPERIAEMLRQYEKEE